MESQQESDFMTTQSQLQRNISRCIRFIQDKLWQKKKAAWFLHCETQSLQKGADKSSFALPPHEAAVSVVTGSISFRVGRVLLRAPYYSTETERGALSERLFIFLGKGTDCCQVDLVKWKQSGWQSLLIWISNEKSCKLRAPRLKK